MHKTALTILAAVFTLPVIVAGALLGATKARADIILTLVFDDTTTSTVTVFNISPTGPFALSGSTPNNLLVNTTVLNASLTIVGGGFSFGSLDASSNNPGLATGSFVVESGVLIVGTPSTSDSFTVTVKAFQTGFTDPIGLGTLADSSSATFVNNPTGTVATHASLDTTDTGISNLVSTGPLSNSQRGFSTIAATAGASYELDATAVLNSLASSSSTTFGDAAGFSTPTTAIPSPATLAFFAPGLGALGLLRWCRKRKLMPRC